MAKVLSSISGNLISAASAGYAPTNSGDVSAIASAYQVVSATGTQLYAGTAHVTSINSAPISASRAGNAANASMATSAYYDGTGRLISALPDSAAVSSIASSYATAKQDASAMTAYAKSADVSGTVNTVANNAANWNGVYTTVYNNSASWSGSTGGGSVTSPSGTIFVNGDKIEGTNSAVLTATSEPGFTVAFGTEGFIPSWTSNELYTGTLPGSGATLYIPTNGHMENATAFISGKDSNMVIITASGANNETPITIYLGAIVSNISASSNTYITINGSVTAEKEGGITVTGIGELAWASSVSGVVNTVSSNSATWGQGGVDSATVSAIASSYAESAASGKADSSSLSSYALSSDVSGCIDTVSNNSASWGAGVSLPITGSAGVDSATYGETSVEFNRYDTAGEPDIRTATLSPDGLDITYTVDENDYYSVHINENGIDFSDPDGYYSVTPYDITNWNSAVETVANNSASWGQGGVDSATVSAIASSYVESGVSSKADSSALSSYALSADVSGTVDLVSTQSANWGGSALALSAGPGITLTKSGNTLVAGLDETLLWSGEIGVEGDTATLSESIEHFQYITIYANPVYAGADNVVSKFETRSGLNACKFGTWSQDGAATYLANYNINLSGTSAGIIRAKRITINNSNGALTVTPNTITGTYMAPVRKIVGLNRTAGV